MSDPEGMWETDVVPIDGYSFDGEVEIGIDEAGRGPVLGPMVYACAFWPAGPEGLAKEMKKKYGFADSKQLTEAQRESIFEKINETRYKDIGYFTCVLTAQYLSNTMLADYDKGGKNLNKISHDSAIALINKVRDLGFTVKRVYADTVGNPAKYRGIIMTALDDPKIDVVVESKADDRYPVVGAASICAKVTRDHALRDFKYMEQGREFSKNVGCGYPGDKITVKWLDDHKDEVFGFPSLVRFSWKTSYAKMTNEGSKAEWFDTQKIAEDYTYNKQELKRREALRQEKENLDRAELKDKPGQLKRKMNIATHRLGISRGFEDF